jgi:hypothetical protein
MVVLARWRFCERSNRAALGGLAANKCHVEEATPELESKERYAEARILYFSPDQRFILLAATVFQGPTSEVISGGDGRVVYLGTWKLTGNSLHVEYRLVSRTVREEGETLPGPVHSEDVRVRGRTLLFQKDRFRRDEKLDDELKAILQGESARQGP